MSLASQILKSSVWVYVSRWFVKLCGVLSTIILARLLTTDDFGVVATVAIVTSLFNVLATTGSNEYLLRMPKISKQALNTAWSINMVMRTLVSVLVFVSAEHAASFFNDERISDVLKVSAFIPFISGFSNIGMVLHQKDMNFKPQFKLDVYSQALTLVVKIALALYLENYWAFVFAELFSIIIRVLISYFLHTHRPSFSFNNWKTQLSYSQWILARGIFVNLRFKIDNIIIARYFPAASLGLYTVAKDIATTPVGQIVTPVIQPLYVGLAQHLNNPKLFADKVHKTILSALFLVFPIAFGISAVADNIVIVFLGDKWLEAIPIVKIIAFVILSGVLNSLMTEVLNLLGKTKANFFLDIFIGTGTIATFALLATHLEIAEFALVRVLLGFISLAVVIIYICSVSELRLVRILCLVAPVFGCAYIMLHAVAMAQTLIITENNILKLLLLIIIGVFSYGTTCFFIINLLKNKVGEYNFVWNTVLIPIKDFCTKKIKNWLNTRKEVN